MKIFYMAGSPIPRETAQRFLDLGVKPQNIYGMTENGSHQYTTADDDVDDHLEHLRPGLPRLRDAALGPGEIRTSRRHPGEIGEIGTRGALLTLGYFDNQPATESSFNACGWFMSGDLGRFDAERQPADRRPQEGSRSSAAATTSIPRASRDLAHRPPGGAQGGGVPGRRRRGSARGSAWRSSRARAPRPAPTSCSRHLDEAGLSKYDMPEYFIAMEAFPLTASGKILKRELVEWAKTGRIEPAPVRLKAGKAA